jgi:hypothetical protein
MSRKSAATLEKIFNIAEARNITTAKAADELAEAIFRDQQESGTGLSPAIA